jgi:putative DNA primase/helicase
MVCAVEHAEHGFVGVHATYLAVDGSCKAAVKPVKRCIGPVGGGAVRLAFNRYRRNLRGCRKRVVLHGSDRDADMGGVSAGGIRSLILPPEIRNVVIACDPDPVGVMAARAAARRWLDEGRRVSICCPPQGLDFNDLAREMLEWR